MKTMVPPLTSATFSQLLTSARIFEAYSARSNLFNPASLTWIERKLRSCRFPSPHLHRLQPFPNLGHCCTVRSWDFQTFSYFGKQRKKKDAAWWLPNRNRACSSLAQLAENCKSSLTWECSQSMTKALSATALGSHCKVVTFSCHDHLLSATFRCNTRVTNVFCCVISYAVWFELENKGQSLQDLLSNIGGYMQTSPNIQDANLSIVCHHTHVNKFFTSLLITKACSRL